MRIAQPGNAAATDLTGSRCTRVRTAQPG